MFELLLCSLFLHLFQRNASVMRTHWPLVGTTVGRGDRDVCSRHTDITV